MNGTWRVCPSCGFSKCFEPGDGSVCNSCLARGNTAPEPLVPYNFGESAPSRRMPSSYDGADALDMLERDAWLELTRARGELIDVEIRHISEGP